MAKSKALRMTFVFLLATCSASLRAQNVSATPELEGLAGSVQVQPNLQRKETTIALHMNYASESKSNQIVFHVQETEPSTSLAWSGQARILVGKGVLAVLPQDGSRSLIFRFAEISRPAVLNGIAFDEHIVYGLARFGEKIPLTAEQIDRLATTGQVSSTTSALGLDSIRVVPDDQSHPTSTPQNIGSGSDCVAGGPGSTSCGASACTVTCSSGYYACCVGGTCTCRENPSH